MVSGIECEGCFGTENILLPTKHFSDFHIIFCFGSFGRKNIGYYLWLFNQEDGTISVEEKVL